MIKYIKAVSRTMAERVSSELKIPHIIISITDPDQELADLCYNPFCVRILRLQFYDIDIDRLKRNTKYSDSWLEPYEGGLFTETQAEQIIDFVETYKDKIEFILIHCEIGISRSAGVAAALSKIYLGEDSSYFKRSFRFVPNMLVYRSILNVAYKGGII